VVGAAATTTALGAIATMLVQVRGFTPAVWIAFVGVVGQALVTYLLSNAEPSAGGRRGPSRLGSRVCLIRG
jgi:hypothetical protein